MPLVQWGHPVQQEFRESLRQLAHPDQQDLGEHLGLLVVPDLKVLLDRWVLLVLLDLQENPPSLAPPDHLAAWDHVVLQDA